MEKEKEKLEKDMRSFITEKERLNEEKGKLEKARLNLKQTLEQGMTLLEGEKGRMEKEIRTRLEMELKKEVQGLKLKLTQVEEERIRDTER